MVSAFEFATASRILFGEGRVAELGPAVAALGKRPLLVTGKSAARSEQARLILQKHRVAPAQLCVPGEPDVDLVTHGAALARSERCDVIVALGGGSVIDAAKAIAALASNQGNVFDYLEVIGKAQPLPFLPLPCVAVPTTAGTGAEVTRNAVIFSPAHRVKASLRHPSMLPRAAIVDPALALNLPPALTASTGMDALTQLIEPFVSKRANPLTDAVCREAIPRVARSLRCAFQNGQDVAARSDMAFASLCGGLALANAGLGAVHGFAAPVGGMFSAPHGAVCAALLAEVMQANIDRAAEENADVASHRYLEVARLLTGNAAARAEDGVVFVRELCRDLAIPSLSDFGIGRDHLPEIAEKAAQTSSMKGNPIALSPLQLAAILERAF